MKLQASVWSPTQLNAVAKEIRDYARELPFKIQQFLEALADRGIATARINEGDFAGYIVYKKEALDDAGNEFGIRLVARDNQPITRYWYVGASDNAEMRSESFSPLLMAEFGSGQYQVDDYGIGRLPGSMGHGGDEKGWKWWSDHYTDGEALTYDNGRILFRSFGAPPTMPIHKAVITMIDEVEEVARSVFG